MLQLNKACASALLACAALLAFSPGGTARAANNYPVVLVHGVLGFGPDAFPASGFLYWGGYGDIAAPMQRYKGPHAVTAAAVGPISSNWDRAAELYTQIKGGCVDYGATHVARNGYPGQAQKPRRQSARLSPRHIPAMGRRPSHPSDRPQPGRHDDPRARAVAGTRLARRR